jgi:hypothetical protein
MPLARAQARIKSYGAASAEQLRALAWHGGSIGLIAPTGGVPVPSQTLYHLRRRLEEFAQGCGYPNPAGRADAAKFDDLALQHLAECEIPIGEGIRPEMWAWISVELVPHLVRWRWPIGEDKLRLERFAGPIIRNAFGRLWYQGQALDRGKDHRERWLYSSLLGADQRVSLFERPSLAGDRSICMTVAAYWASLPENGRSEELFREAMKALVVRIGVQHLDMLTPAELEEVVTTCFAETRTRLRLGTSRR